MTLGTEQGKTTEGETPTDGVEAYKKANGPVAVYLGPSWEVVGR